MKMFAVFMLALVVLVGCGSTADFVRDEGSVREYDRAFADGEWAYSEYLVSRTEGFQTVHTSVAIQVARSLSNDDQIVSIAFQSDSHDFVRDNMIVLLIDGSPVVIRNPEIAAKTSMFRSSTVERNVVPLESSVIQALLNASTVTIDFIEPVELSYDEITSMQAFLAANYEV